MPVCASLRNIVRVVAAVVRFVYLRLTTRFWSGLQRYGATFICNFVYALPISFTPKSACISTLYKNIIFNFGQLNLPTSKPGCLVVAEFRPAWPCRMWGPFTTTPITARLPQPKCILPAREWAICIGCFCSRWCLPGQLHFGWQFSYRNCGLQNRP